MDLPIVAGGERHSGNGGEGYRSGEGMDET